MIDEVRTLIRGIKILEKELVRNYSVDILERLLNLQGCLNHLVFYTFGERK
jgi:hypothetical protein